MVRFLAPFLAAALVMVPQPGSAAETDLWLGGRPEFAVAALNPDDPTPEALGFFVPRFELGWASRWGRFVLGGALDAGVLISAPMNFSMARTVVLPLVGIAIQPGGVIPGTRANALLGARVSLDIAVNLLEDRGEDAAPVVPFVTVGGSFGFETPAAAGAPRLRVTFEPGIVLPFPTFSLGVSIAASLL